VPIEVDQVHRRPPVERLVDPEELLDGGVGAAPGERVELADAHDALDGEHGPRRAPLGQELPPPRGPTFGSGRAAALRTGGPAAAFLIGFAVLPAAAFATTTFFGTGFATGALGEGLAERFAAAFFVTGAGFGATLALVSTAAGFAAGLTAGLRVAGAAFGCALPFAGPVATGFAGDVGRTRAGVRDGVGFEADTRAPDTFGIDPARSSHGPE
jgi:hypothetical protein